MCGIVLKLLATPAGIEPATNSLEVARNVNDFNGRSDKAALPGELLDEARFPFVGMETPTLETKNCLLTLRPATADDHFAATRPFVLRKHPVPMIYITPDDPNLARTT